MKKHNSNRSTRDAFEKLDRVIHEKARLEILTTLLGKPDGISFNDLRDLCALTDGNLNRHLKVLIDSRLVSRKKTGRGRSTLSQYYLSARGKKAFEQYLSALESIVRSASDAESKLGAQNAASSNARPGDGQISVSPG